MVCARFLPSPSLNGYSGNGKIVHQEQLGVPTQISDSSPGSLKGFDWRLNFCESV